MLDFVSQILPLIFQVLKRVLRLFNLYHQCLFFLLVCYKARIINFFIILNDLDESQIRFLKFIHNIFEMLFVKWNVKLSFYWVSLISVVIKFSLLFFILVLLLLFIFLLKVFEFFLLSYKYRTLACWLRFFLLYHSLLVILKLSLLSIYELFSNHIDKLLLSSKWRHLKIWILNLHVYMIYFLNISINLLV